MTFGPWSNESTFTTQSAGTGVLAAQSELFAASIGVNVHFNFAAVWSDYVHWMPTLQAVNYRTMRTTIGGGTGARIAELVTGGVHAQSVSPKFLILCNPPEADPGTISGNLNTIQSYGLQNIAGIELSNEIQSTSGSSKITGTWDQRIDKAITYASAFQTALNARRASNSAWDNITLLGPSIWGRQYTFIDAVLTHNSGLGWGPYVEAQPCHLYTGGREPTLFGPAEQDAADNVQHTIEDEIAKHKTLVQNSPTKPMWFTECGWQMDDGGKTPQLGLNGTRCTETASSKYLGRMYLENFKRGVVRSYDYAWLNNPQTPGMYFGKLNHNTPAPYNYTPRNHIAMLTRLISITGDPGAAFTPGRLPYSFSGPGFDADFSHMLLQKRNGIFNLLCTTDKVSYNRSTFTDINTTAPVTLNLGAVRSLVRTTTPYSTASWTTAGTNVSSVNLTVPDHLMIIEITP